MIRCTGMSAAWSGASEIDFELKNGLKITLRCGGNLGKEVTSQIDCVMHGEHMYKPCWGRINREKIQKNYGYIKFVVIPDTFNLDFPKNHDFDDLGKVVMKILNFVCSDGPGRWVGAQGCLKHDLESPR